MTQILAGILIFYGSLMKNLATEKIVFLAIKLQSVQVKWYVVFLDVIASLDYVLWLRFIMIQIYPIGLAGRLSSLSIIFF